MIVVSLAGQIRARQAEWQASGSILIFGMVLILPLPVFDSPSFIAFAQLAPQHAWGAIFAIVGALRVAGLIINGRRATITGWMRIASSVAGLLLFMTAAIGFAASVGVSTWLAMYVPAAISEGFNAYWAAVDTGSAWKARTVKRGHAASST